MVVERLASRLGLAISTVSFHLKKLEDSGLVTSKKDQYYKQYSVNREILDQTLSDLVTLDENPLMKDRDEAYRQKVIATFFSDGVCDQLPVQKKKRIIVLEEIAKAFESKKQYTENEVDKILKPYHHDHCTLRRDLVDYGFLSRNNGVYKKII